MRRLLFAAGAAAALMFAAACGDDAGDDGEVASAGGEAEESESAEEVDQEEALLEFSACMRENGVEEFPDPTDDGMAIDRDMLDDPDFEAASEACSEIHEFGLGGDD